MTTSTSPPPPSALTSLISASNNPPTPNSATTTQILHNLQHQHLWTSLETHPLTLPHSQSSQSEQPAIYLISGNPPHRLYTHPDEQLYMLEKGLRDQDMPAERMIVLPLAQGQSWSLRRLAGVFDSLPETTDQLGGVNGGDWRHSDKADKLAEYYERRKTARDTREWGGKKLLLAMVDKSMGGDGTVVYYVVQEGAVKPRQN